MDIVEKKVSLYSEGEISMDIWTVGGPISENELGRTYIHEHLSIDLSHIKKDDDAKLNDIEGIVNELKELKKSGIDSMVEVTNIGMGRNIDVLIDIWKKTGINIIPSTGFYKEPFYPEEIYSLDYKDISKIIIDEIKKGINDTGIKAHVIGEIGSSKDVITDMELKLFKAGIYAHLETGNPIFTHTTLGTMALEQIALFKDYRVDMSKVLIGHLDLKCDYDYHLNIADTGCFLGFDTIGKENYEKDEIRIAHIKRLIEKGHMDQIVISQDITRKSHLKKNGGIGYSYITEVFIPKAISYGITERQIDHILVKNPKRLLGV